MSDADHESRDGRGSPLPSSGGGRKSIMRSLGEFFGHIAQGVKTPARPAADEPQRRVIRETVEEEQRDSPQGKVTLRRTIIEEVELPPRNAGDRGPEDGPKGTGEERGPG